MVNGMIDRKYIYLIPALVTIAVAFVATVYFTRTAEPETPAQTLPSRAQGAVVTIHDLIGLSPAEAERTLGYPDHDPFGSPAKIIGQNDAVDLHAPTIITAACMRLNDNPDKLPAVVVFEVANPNQINADELAALKESTYESRQHHIKNATGCYSDTLGVFVNHPS